MDNINRDAVYFYSLTKDDLIFLKSVHIKLSEREQARLDDFLQESEHDIHTRESMCRL